MKLERQTERAAPCPTAGPARPSQAGPAVPSETEARRPLSARPSARPASQARSRANTARHLRPSARAAGGVASFVPTPQRTYKAGERPSRPLFPRGAPAVTVYGVMERRFSLVPSTLYIKLLMEGPSQVQEYWSGMNSF
ncbi:uncharacterized protein GJ701_001346 isoform 1-T1 [Geothlypis trichas]